jgi:branched-subunit amino acid aminotransferase/4-amino-4-deoxychorismate lyase
MTKLIKAYLGPDGKARLFRPELNVARMARSAVRAALPVSTTSIESIRQLDGLYSAFR